jgi:hypothetical protein
MGENGKVVINLATGLEDAERVTLAFLVGGAAVAQGKRVAMFLTKEAVRLGIPGNSEAVACDGCPPLPRLVEQYADGGGDAAVGVGRRRRGDRLQLLGPAPRTPGKRVAWPRAAQVSSRLTGASSRYATSTG